MVWNFGSYGVTGVPKRQYKKGVKTSNARGTAPVLSGGFIRKARKMKFSTRESWKKIGEPERLGVRVSRKNRVFADPERPGVLRVPSDPSGLASEAAEREIFPPSNRREFFFSRRSPDRER